MTTDVVENNQEGATQSETYPGKYRVIQLIKTPGPGGTSVPTDVEVVFDLRGGLSTDQLTSPPAEISEPIKKSVVVVPGTKRPLYFKTLTDESEIQKARQLFETRKMHMVPSPLPPLFVELIPIPDAESGKYQDRPRIHVDPPLK